MIIVMQAGAPRTQTDNIIEELKNKGLQPMPDHEIFSMRKFKRIIFQHGKGRN